MKDFEIKRSIQVIGPDGSVLTHSDLPPSSRVRWVPRRKAQVVAAVHGGLLTMPDACRRYAISIEEFLEWERDYEAYGLKGLRAATKAGRRKMFH